MRRRLLLIVVLLIGFICLKAQLLKTNNGIILKNFGCNTLSLSIEIISNNIIHVVASPTKPLLSTTVTKIIPDQSPFSLKISNEDIVLKTDSLQICVNPNNGKITFKDKRNHIILQENNRTYRPCKQVMKYLWSITQEFNWETEESLYAYLESNGSNANITGKQFGFVKPSSPCQYPLISSSKGYGILWLNNSLSKFNNINDKSYLWSEKAVQVEYYFLYAPTASELSDDYNKLTSVLAEGSKNSQADISTKSSDND